MFSHMEPIDIECDAPSYAFAEACGKLGYQSPLDVPWCRISHFLGNQCEAGVGFHLLGWLFSGSQHRMTTCTCGQPLPIMESCIAIYETGEDGHYLLGQCSRCRKMFWEEEPENNRIG